MGAVTIGNPAHSRLLAALLLVSFFLGAPVCGTTADGGPESTQACCVRLASGGDMLESGPEPPPGDAWSCPGMCPGIVLPCSVADCNVGGAHALLEPPDEWLAGCSPAPDPFPPRNLCIV